MINCPDCRYERWQQARPRPHFPAERPVAHARGLRGTCLLIGGEGIELEKRVGVRSVLTLALLLERIARHRLLGEDAALVCIRSDDHRHIVLFSGFEDRHHILREDPAVDGRRRLESIGAIHGGGGHRAERAQRRRAGSLGKLRTGLLRVRQRARNRKLRAAFTDRALKEPVGERRGHEVVDAPRSSRLSKNRHAGRKSSGVENRRPQDFRRGPAGQSEARRDIGAQVICRPCRSIHPPHRPMSNREDDDPIHALHEPASYAHRL